MEVIDISDNIALESVVTAANNTSYIKNGVAYLNFQLVLQQDAPTATTILTLPSNCRPKKELIIPVIVRNAEQTDFTVSQLELRTTGVMRYGMIPTIAAGYRIACVFRFLLRNIYAIRTAAKTA